MTRSEAVSLIQRRLGNRTDLEDDIITEMQLAQIELEQGPVLPWFLLSLDSTLTTEASENDRLALPTDFLREYEEDDLEWNNDGTWTPLDKDDYDALKKAELSLFTTPSFYTVVGSNIYLRPSPEEQITLRMNYYAKAALLTTNIENAWLEHVPGVLINRTGLEMAKYLQNQKAEALFEKSLLRSTNAMWTTHEQRMLANQDLRMRFSATEE